MAWILPGMEIGKKMGVVLIFDQRWAFLSQINNS